ncbi:MAG: DNA polymerase I [Oscillospiraceae bacterium]
MKLIIIDGNSIVNRAFYGVHMLNAPDGTPTNAVFGFLNIYRRLMADEAPEAVCVTFDLPAPTFRHEQYEGYKAQRKGMPDELAVQMPILKETLDAMNVCRYELAGWEADDLIGSIAKRCGASGWDCVVVTGDKDSFQLIDGHTSVKHVKTRAGQTEVKLYDEQAFIDEYGFEPPLMVDLKALMGDASDNIPGVAGVGEKTAMDLIQRFGRVESIYENLDTLDIKEPVRRKLTAGADSARMSYELATIHRDAPVEFSPEQARVCPPDNDKLWEVFTRLGFKKLIEAFGLVPPSDGKASAGEVQRFEGACNSVEVASEETLAVMKSGLEGRLCAVRFSGDMSICAVLPDECDTAYIIRESSPVYREAMDALCSGNIKKAGHDIKDAQRELLRWGFSSDGWVFDSALAAYLIEPTASGYDINRLTEKYCGFTIMGEAAVGEQLSLLSDDTQIIARIMSESAAILCLRGTLETKLRELGLDKVFYDIELPLCRVLSKMELAGFLVDKKALEDFGAVLAAQITSLEEQIYAIAGESFNINSPKQLGDILFNKLMLPAPKKTKTGYSTNADVLEKLRPKNPIIGLVLEYRELAKLKSTYAEGLSKVIAPDGRIHTSFQMTVTATGRLSSTEPNLQNIPIRRELGGEIRKMFVASPGNVLVDADYSQIELRILAHISGDKTMKNAFLSGEDIHRITAAQVLGIPPEEVTARERSHAKAVNFGIVYGISAFSLSEDIGVSVAEARDYINTYMARYHGVRDYMERVVLEARETGCAVTLYGRRRPLPELKSTNFSMRSFGERVARNMPIQGTAADIMKIAMINVDRALGAAGLKARLLLQVHDELIVECPEEEAQQVRELLCREMEGAAALSVPLTVDAHVGKTWYEAK